MSDDDLWRPKEPAPDETQPISGSESVPPAPPPTPPAPAPSSPASDPHATPTGPGAVPPPYNPYAGGPAPQPGPHGNQGYVPPPNPYGAPQEFAQPQSPYGSPYQPAYAGGQVPEHPSATTAMVLGIIGLVGVFLCAGVTLILSPAAWVVGSKALREIDAAPGRYAGRDRAQSGKIMGIIGTVLLVLGVLAIVGVIVLAVASSPDPAPAVHHQGGV
ncbi:MAG: DUF4190 domain-containing protein [Nocardioides sp.]